MEKFTVKYMDYSLIYHHDCTLEDFCEECGIDPEENSNACGLTVTESEDIYRVWAKDNKPHIIAHECLHVVFFINWHMNVILSQESAEGYTHLLDYFIKEINLKLNKYEQSTSRRSKKLLKGQIQTTA